MGDDKKRRDAEEETAGSDWRNALDAGLALLPEVLSAGLDRDARLQAETLLSLCHLLAFRLRTGSHVPLIGILGSANSGKSTLMNSIAGADISEVTPIPHQTIGPILAVPSDFAREAKDPSFLRPIAEEVERAAAGTGRLSGTPLSATAVEAWDATEMPFVLVDLPDLGTVDSREERQVALHMLPWLDRVILVVTEESFAQSDHEEIDGALKILHPERARAELYVALNRRHTRTTESEFASRLSSLHAFWADAAISTLPNLREGERFPGSETAPLVAESHARVTRVLERALRTLTSEVAADVEAVAIDRSREIALLTTRLKDEIRIASRFRKAFFHNDFRARLDSYSPWRLSINKIQAIMGKEPPPPTASVDLLAEAPVHRHVMGALQEIGSLVEDRLARLYGPAAKGQAPVVPKPDETAIRTDVADLVGRTNERARKDVETFLASLREDKKVKDPLWSLTAAVASTLFLVDLLVPSVGTLGTLALSGALSALGFGGVITSDVLRKIRTSRLKENFERDLQRILDERISSTLASEAVAGLDMTDLTRRIDQWSTGLPEE